MNTPPYFKQQKSYTCSLAVLRMILAQHNITVTETELLKHIEQNYPKGFKNIWNPTIAKLAQQYGLKTTLISDWQLLKPKNLTQAISDYQQNPETFNYKQYENETDGNHFEEPLDLAYAEMINAIELGVSTKYKKIDQKELITLLHRGCLMILSVKLEQLYPDKKGYHTILLYHIDENMVHYHDPAYGESQSINLQALLSASLDTGSAIVIS